MGIGKAHGFLNYDKPEELDRLMGEMYKRSNFHLDAPDFELKVLTDTERKALEAVSIGVRPTNRTGNPELDKAIRRILNRSS